MRTRLLRSTIQIIEIQISEIGVGRVVIVIGNERIIRFGVPVTHDANFAANRVLDKKELFSVGKQIQILFGKLETRIECEAR